MTSPETDGGSVLLSGAGPLNALAVELADPNGFPTPAGEIEAVRSSLVASPLVAAILSFLVPGLGQASTGAFRRGALMAIPTLAVVAAAATALAAGPAVALGILLRPEIIVSLLAMNAAFGVYHLVAIADAWGLGLPIPDRHGASGRRTHALLGGVVGATVVLHGAIGIVGFQALDTLDRVFPGDSSLAIPQASFDPVPLPSGIPATTPAPAKAAPAWAGDGVLNLLLIGSDAGPERWSLRTDTMIVLSVDVASARAVLIGIPRNLVGVPLPRESAKAFRDGRFPDLLNALYVYAMDHPNHFPGGDARGFRAVTGAIQQLLGLQMDGLTVINLQGFVSLVNAIGGLWIDVPEPLYEPAYPLETGRGHIVLNVRTGCQRLDGRMALAYARSRYQDSDYGRMRRQQAVLTALAEQVEPIAMLPRVPELLGIAKENLWTTIPREDVAGLAELAARIDAGAIRTVMLTPPVYPSPLTSATLNKIRLAARQLLIEPAAAPTAAATTRPGAPATPTPRARSNARVTPTPRATATLQATPTPGATTATPAPRSSGVPSACPA